jgi:hypothetical protein
LSLNFDQSNPINEYSTALKERPELKDKSIKQQELVVINSLLFIRKTNMKGARPNEIQAKKPMAERFWKQVLAIPHVLERESVAQPVVLKALASIAWALNKNLEEVNLNTLFNEIPKFDFSHQNPLWRFYELTPEERKRYGLTGLESYLPPDDPGIIRTVGIYKEEAKGKKGAKNGRMHWSIAHNTVYPLLADMIRWKLELPPRKHQVRTKAIKVED